MEVPLKGGLGRAPGRGIKLSARYELRDITQGTRLPDRDLFDIRLTLGF